MWYIYVMYRVVHDTAPGGSVRTLDITLLLVLGVAIWVFGTIYFAYAGPGLLETSSRRYWITFTISPIISSIVCIAIVSWRQIPKADWAAAMLLLALPGMIGEAAVLTHLTTFMPKLQATSGGRYGAFLFATYAIVLGVAEVVTLNAH
jgi:hypothetical protein